MVTLGPPRGTASSLRRLLILALSGAALYVASVGIAVSAVFIPRITELRSDTQDLLTQLEAFSGAAIRLDSTVVEARHLVVTDDLAGALRVVDAARLGLPTSYTLAVRRPVAGTPVEMRRALAAALTQESGVRDLLSEVHALLALERRDAASIALSRADSMAAALLASLTTAQQAGFHDVARRGAALEATAKRAALTLGFLSLVGLVLTVGVVVLVRRRLYLPLAALDSGMRAASTGDFDARVEVARDDEMGRLGALFNRMVHELRQRGLQHENERKAMTRRILDASLDGVITTTPEGVITGWNPSAEAIFGWSADEAVGERLEEMISPESKRESHRLWGEGIVAGVAANVVTQRFEVGLQRRDGRPFTAELAIAPIIEGGQVVALAGFFRDISETLELQDQVRRSQRLEAVGRLAGGIAHDFNNLVAVILGQTQLALEQIDDADMRQGLLEVERAADRAATLTSQLLAFARKQVTAPKIMDVNDVVQETLTMVGRVLESSVRLVPSLDPEAGHVSVDPDHFSQVLLNLLMNARDAIGTDGGAVFIVTGSVEISDDGGPLQVPAGTYVVVNVSDDGPGISDDARQRIFEPFFSTKPKGTGLGLATCHGIVRQSGGAITARNRAEGGAEFVVYLPRITPPNVSVAPPT